MQQANLNHDLNTHLLQLLREKEEHIIYLEGKIDELWIDRMPDIADILGHIGLEGSVYKRQVPEENEEEAPEGEPKEEPEKVPEEEYEEELDGDSEDEQEEYFEEDLEKDPDYEPEWDSKSGLNGST